MDRKISIRNYDSKPPYHGQKKRTHMQKKTVDFSKTEQVHLVQTADLNGAGRLFGGVLLKLIDEVAAIVAMRHTGRKTVTTVAIDNLTFKAAAYNNDLIVLVGYVTYTGRTSIEVRVDTYVERADGMRTPINRAHIVLVALDDEGHPTEVPQLLLENDIQKEEFLMGEKRKALRLERQKSGF